MIAPKAPRGRTGRAEDQIAHLSIPKAGEQANGDQIVVRRGTDGRILVGIVDGLGHGRGAEEASRAAVDLLESAPPELELGELMERVHARLRGTRGAAATLCLVDDQKLDACGVGNVELRCAETDIPFVYSPGILGSRVQRFRVCSARTSPATRLILFSDGLQEVSRLEEFRKLSPAQACRAILDKHRRTYDDATVLIADFG